MKLTKSILLGSAAAFLAMTGAEAADAPIETYDYVRICDAYGNGFYYIPGTETCLRISGLMRWRARYFHENEYTRGFDAAINSDNQTVFDMDGRFRMRVDAREETDYGTLRGFAELEASGDNDAGFNLRHAYVQIAGITAGLTGTTFNADHGFVGPNYGTAAGDGGNSRLPQIRYTQPFGNGFSISIALEESDQSDTSIYGAAYGGDDIPDAVLSLGVTQGWGSFGLSGLAREVEVYNGVDTDSEFGWAVRGSLRVNLDFLGNGGVIGARATYTSGASNYAADWAADAVYTAGDIELVETWGIQGGIEVGLTPTLTGTLFGGYATVLDIDGLNLSAANAHTETWWNIGANVLWAATDNLDVGLEVIYNREEYEVGLTGLEDDDDYLEVHVGMQRNF